MNDVAAAAAVVVVEQRCRREMNEGEMLLRL